MGEHSSLDYWGHESINRAKEHYIPLQRMCVDAGYVVKEGARSILRSTFMVSTTVPLVVGNLGSEMDVGRLPR